MRFPAWVDNTDKAPPNLIAPQWWHNICEVSTDPYNTLAQHNAIIIYDNDTEKHYIEFPSEEEATLFFLKWQ
jgi:hypothetical protein